MSLKVLVLVATVVIFEVFAEPPLQSRQVQEPSGPYRPSGWKPAGPAFRLPERPPLPVTFFQSSRQTQVDLTYGPPQEEPEATETGSQNRDDLKRQRSNIGRLGELPQERNRNQFQKENYVAQSNGRFNQPVLTATFSKINRNQEQSGGTENQVDLTSNVSQETLSAPNNQPAVTYGPPTEENNFEEGSGKGDIPSESFSRSNNRQRGGIEYQVDLTYGAPQETLVVPPNQPAVTYGPPQEESTTTVEPESTTTELPTTTEINTEETTDNDENKEATGENELNKENLRENLEQANEEKGVYYIYHPTGLLQRVVYSGNDDQSNMAFSARLKYENVEPINGPVYTYDPETFVFRRLY